MANVHDDLIFELPVAHAVALRLRKRGASDEMIGDLLGIDPDEAINLVKVAEAKLAALTAAAKSPPERH